MAAKKRKPLGRDDVKVSRSTKGTKTVYRNPKKKNITKLPPAVKNKEYWQGV